MSSIIPSQEAMNLGVQLGYIYVTVRAQNGDGILFRIKKSTKLKKLMDAYCEMLSLNPNTVYFFFDRRYLLGWQTPFEVGMESGAEIDAMLHQTGGGPLV